MNLREALKTDISILAKHHRMMFEEIWEHKGDCLEPALAIEIENTYIKKLEVELLNGICKAWIIEDKGKIISSGAITLISSVPNPSDISFKAAYLHSMYSEKSYRNQKCAQRIINKLIDHCRSQGVKRVMLNASSAGKPIYKKIGFYPVPETMRLIIN